MLLLSGCGDDGEGSLAIAPPSSLRVMAFNVLCSFCDIRNYDPWNQRLAYFGDIFSRYDLDLIGLQELSPPPLNGGLEVEQVLEQAPGFAAISFRPAAGVAVAPYPDATIFYRTDRFTVLEQGEYWLSPTPDEPLTTGFASPQLPRLVVWARLRDHQVDREIYFATTHFDNNSPSQELSAPLVQERTAPFAARLPVILVGDFNSRPTSNAYRILTADPSHGVVFLNAYDHAPQRRLVSNQDPVPAFDAASRIDHIFLAGDGVDWSVSDWAVDLTVYGERNRYPSDHFAIFAEVGYR